MDINAIKNEILFIHEAINEEVEMIIKHKDKIPRIELDMIMSNLQKLYEYFYKLQKLNEELSTKPLAEADIPKEPEKPKAEEKEITETLHVEKTPTVEEELKPEKLEFKPVETIQQTEENPVETIQQSEEKPVETKTHIKPEKPKIPEQKKSTLDLFAETSTTIGDKFLEKKDNSIAASMSHNHITNIKKAIGINEKFLFINGLFNGNMQEYNQVLDKLNSINDVNEAGNFIDELKSKNNWKTEEDPFIQFMEVIKRKFSI